MSRPAIALHVAFMEKFLVGLEDSKRSHLLHDLLSGDLSRTVN
jgi:hypothetical protein